jgi:DNA-directed RNA polymerase subunit RPC12/RpoP
VRPLAALAIRSAQMLTHAYSFVPTDQRARLSYREAQVLDYLASHAGRFVPGDELARAMLGDYCHRSAPHVYVWRLRQKLGSRVIETERPFGYRIPVRQAELLSWRCSRCHRAAVRHGMAWTCYGCGATGEWVDVSPLPAGQYECARCGRIVERSAREVAYEQSRRPGARVFCSLPCAQAQGADERRKRR